MLGYIAFLADALPKPALAPILVFVALDITDHAAVIAFAKTENIDFVVVGPDAQVVAGLGDDVRAAGIACFCPSKAAGQLEGSKSFTKALCDEFDIPTALYARFEDEVFSLHGRDEIGAMWTMLCQATRASGAAHWRLAAR